MFSTFANSFQSFSFYENQFDLLGKQYINPIARGGIRRYFFILEDTTIVNNDTTFTISYRPQAGKTFSGLKGYLFINSNGYAVEKVIAEPYDDSSGMQMRIVQEYKFIDEKKWFPINKKQLEKASLWFLNYGKWSLLLSWVPFVGDPLTVVAGVLRVPIITFLIIVSISKILRYVIVSLIALNLF